MRYKYIIAPDLEMHLAGLKQFKADEYFNPVVSAKKYLVEKYKPTTVDTLRHPMVVEYMSLLQDVDTQSEDFQIKLRRSNELNEITCLDNTGKLAIYKHEIQSTIETHTPRPICSVYGLFIPNHRDGQKSRKIISLHAIEILDKINDRRILFAPDVVLEFNFSKLRTY